MSKSPLVNELKAEDWSGNMGERWLAHLEQFESGIAPIGAALIERAGFRAGERVIDVGCGAGVTTLEIARQVGAPGLALGLDISPALLERATQRARAAGLQNIRFVCADASTAHPEGAPFSRLFSRFGLMFFAEPVPAFRNLRSLVVAGARADFSVWAPARENAWVAQLMSVLSRHMTLPAPVPRAPGPFAFDDPTYLREVLHQSGFGSVEIDTWEGKQLLGGRGASAQGAADFVLDAMSFGALLEEANPAAREPAGRELAELFTRFATPDGIAMACKAFLVTARATREETAAQLQPTEKS